MESRFFLSPPPRPPHCDISLLGLLFGVFHEFAYVLKFSLFFSLFFFGGGLI